jgi:cysteine desulfurase
MYANNETGVIFPIEEIAKVCREKNVFFHTDATQAVGKLPINLRNTPIDLLSLSAHKLYGAKGIGALYVNRNNPKLKVIAQMDGGKHERGMRSGTLNVPGIVSLGKACDLARLEMS